MNIKDFGDVQKLISIKGKLEKALTKLDWPCLTEEDCGGVLGFKTGYGICLSEHSDGSGDFVDLSGCYVANEILEATKQVLESHLSKVDNSLQALGVSTKA
jgi:hypothetical protein